eukprot:1148035-Alexandrium_andersonii.AAC.1
MRRCADCAHAYVIHENAHANMRTCERPGARAHALHAHHAHAHAHRRGHAHAGVSVHWHVHAYVGALNSAP